MFPRLPGWSLVGLGLLALGGCLSPVQEKVDRTVSDLAAHAIDPPSPGAAAPSLAPPAAGGTGKEGAAAARLTGEIVPVSALVPQRGEETPPGTRPRPQILKIPPDLPGVGAAPEIRYPPPGPEHRAEREQVVKQLFPPLPDLGPDPQPVAGPNGQPLTLSDLERLAMSTSPLLRQSAADVTAGAGAARQAGAYPNPTVGYEADTIGNAGTAGFQGAYFDQTIRTAGKLKLSEAMALMDLENNKLALRRAQTDLEANVRSAYFAVLIAQENMRVSRALVDVTDQVYQFLLLQFRLGGIAAPYEPMQLRVYSFTARGALVQARNTYLAAWRQLVAALGVPAMPPTELAGRADMPVPEYDWDRAVSRVLAAHTDVLTARVTEKRARYNLRLQQVTPVPDVNVHLVLQKDFTAVPHSVVTTVQVGLPVPLWDQNQGAIIQAQGQLLRAVEESHRVRDDLTGRLADAFQRYRTNLVLLEYYRSHVLPDAVRYYRGVINRYLRGEAGGAAFADVVNAQQALSTAVATYIATLTALWQAVSDMASLLQTDDLFQVAGQHCLEPAPDLAELLKLPCAHPCSPVPDPALKGAPLGWPVYEPGARTPGRDAGATGPEMPVPAPRSDAAPTGPELAPPAFNVPVRLPAAETMAPSNDRPGAKAPAYLPPADDVPPLPTPCPVPTGGG
jgi:cobalt-zinc-cadmium efflux system outer membrane protein